MAISTLEQIEEQVKTEMAMEGISKVEKDTLQKRLSQIREIKGMYSNRVDEIIQTGKVVVYENGDVRFVWDRKDNRIEEGGIETRFTQNEMILALGGDIFEVASMVKSKYESLLQRKNRMEEEEQREELAQAA